MKMNPNEHQGLRVLTRLQHEAEQTKRMVGFSGPIDPAILQGKYKTMKAMLAFFYNDYLRRYEQTTNEVFPGSTREIPSRSDILEEERSCGICRESGIENADDDSQELMFY